MQSIIMLLVGLLTAAFGFFGVPLHLAANVSTVGVIGGILLILAWVFTAGLQDLKDFINGVVTQAKWSDPSFYSTLIVALLVPITTTYGLHLSDATIGIVSSILAIAVPILMKIFHKTDPVLATLRGDTRLLKILR